MEAQGPVGSGRLTVVLVDDHPLICQAVQAVLVARGMTVLGSAIDSDSGLSCIERCRPHVAVVDLDLPPSGGRELVNAVRRSGLRTGVVVFTGIERGRSLADVLDAGADAIVAKRSPMDVLVSAIEVAAEGGSFIDRSLREAILPRGPDGRWLSPRERAVLRELALGHTIDEIAESLVLSHETIRTHVRNARAKLGARTGAEAVAIALRDGEIEPGS
jgi:DNA-binding NarL/FixJ family response regulator